MEKRRVAVRTMVETILLSGSLSPAASSQRMLEGILGHRALQAVPAEDAQNEVSVSGTVSSARIELTVHGRIDRLYGGARVEEIKTTYQPPELLGGDLQHWAQAKCYALLLADAQSLAELDVSLTYVHLGTGEITTFTERYAYSALQAFFTQLASRYLDLLEHELTHRLALKQDLAAMAFPYPAFRAGQRELAEQVFYAIREKSPLLAQAPTGTGKTMAVLFPALKALAEGHAEKLFYLTARTTQQEAAVTAARLLDAPHLRTVVLTAKEKACIYDTPICREGSCPRADGYYDRLGDALAAMQEQTGPFTRDVIAAYAARFFLCPFELSLDLSLSCDLIVCDYNYAFDPRVRLQRFFIVSKNKFALLIDEAHNLPGRARSMYTAALSLPQIVGTRRSIAKQHRKRPLYLALSALEKAIAACFASLDVPAARQEPPESLISPVENALDALSSGEGLADPALQRELTFSLSAFRFVYALYDDNFSTLYEGAKASRRITLFCADAAEKLAETYKKCRSAVLFSATLTPYGFYKDLCGLKPETPVFSLPPPFPPEHLMVLHLPLDMRYRAREYTISAAADAAAAFVLARGRGNYLVFAPSFSYLGKLAPLLEEKLPNCALLYQSPDMDDAAREAFLAQFRPDGDAVTVGLAVMGGVFAEGIDLPDERLCGAVVIGVGMPQICLERDVLRDAYEKKYESGFRYAYQYPGVCKVLQAGGRIIRTESDRGALLLIDTRYAREEYRALLPPHWNVARVQNTDDLTMRLCAFWGV